MGNLFSSTSSVSAVAAAAASALVPAAIALLILRGRHRLFKSRNEGTAASGVDVGERQKTELSPEAIQSKQKFLAALALADGDTENHRVQVAYEDLSSFYDTEREDGRQQQDLSVILEGKWRQLSMPTFPGCLGTNAAGDRQYTMGRMSFGVLKPSDMVVSMQDVENPIYQPDLVRVKGSGGALVPYVEGKPVVLPEERIKSLVKEDPTKVRVYTFLVSFTIEDDRYCKRPIEGLMENRGYTIPDPDNEHRMLVWFTGGRFWPRYRRDVRAWCDAFCVGNSASVLGEWRSWLYRCATLETLHEEEEYNPSDEAQKGGTEDEEGSEPQGPVFAYQTKKPMPGHFDILYLDDDLRITRGNRGTVIANSRVPS